jgi:hypothetical protein
MTQWDRARAFVPSQDKIARGDMYLSWSPASLQLGLFWQEDLQSESFYKNGKIPDADRTIIEVEIPASKLVWRVRINEKDGTVLNGRNWKMTVRSNTSTHQAFWLQIPPGVFGMRSFKPGYEVHVKVRLISETKAYATHWDTTRHLAQ